MAVNRLDFPNAPDGSINEEDRYLLGVGYTNPSFTPPVVNLIISRSSSGAQIRDRLINDQIGTNHGEVTNNVTTLEELFFIRHDGVDPIQNLKVFLDGLLEILQWADSNAGDGLLLDTNNNGTFDVNFKTGVGDSLVNAINLGDINPAEEKVIVVKINVPSGESNEGIRNFNLNYNFDFTS